MQNLIDLPIEIIINILEIAENVKSKLVCHLFYTIYCNNAYKINTNINILLARKISFEDIPLNILSDIFFYKDIFSELYLNFRKKQPFKKIYNLTFKKSKCYY